MEQSAESRASKSFPLCAWRHALCDPALALWCCRLSPFLGRCRRRFFGCWLFRSSLLCGLHGGGNRGQKPLGAKLSPLFCPLPSSRKFPISFTPWHRTSIHSSWVKSSETSQTTPHSIHDQTPSSDGEQRGIQHKRLISSMIRSVREAASASCPAKRGEPTWTLTRLLHPTLLP